MLPILQVQDKVILLIGVQRAPPVIGGDSFGTKVSHGKHPVGEVDVHGEKHQVVLKQVYVARPAV